jgi:hypothetical protein
MVYGTVTPGSLPLDCVVTIYALKIDKIRFPILYAITVQIDRGLTFQI